MSASSSKAHWEAVYSTKAVDAVSWYQPRADLSLRLIHDTQASCFAPLIDVGAGASTLVDGLVAQGWSDLTLLDLSAAALSIARSRIGPDSPAKLRWIEADITSAELPAQAYEIWHDRAVFHFLTSMQDRQAYVRAAAHAIRPGGHLIVGAFAEDGPTQCSGLNIRRYGADALFKEFGEAFTPVRHVRDLHATPFGTTQAFVYCCWRRAGS